MTKKHLLTISFIVLSAIVLVSCTNTQAVVSEKSTTTLPLAESTSVTESTTVNTTVQKTDNASAESSISQATKTTNTETAKASTNKPTSPNTKTDKAVQTSKAKSTPNSTEIKSTEKQTTKKVTTTTKPTTTKQHTTTQKSFDVSYYVSYAKNYAKSIGLNLDSSCTDCWDNPISANANCSNLERDIRNRLNRYKNSEGFTDVWIWAESSGNGNYNIYIGYA